MPYKCIYNKSQNITNTCKHFIYINTKYTYINSVVNMDIAETGCIKNVYLYSIHNKNEI